MQLIGMLDSPYVRRVAISMQLLGLPFTHRPLSVFSNFDQFRLINPVVKAPSLVCDDGTVLLDSTLILDYLEHLPLAARALMPASGAQRQRALRLVGLALAACDKSVQLVYERNLRPVEKQYERWIARVTGQLLAAYEGLEAELARQPLAVASGTIDQAGITSAVAWKFTQVLLSEVLNEADFPALAGLSAAAEALAEFRAAPHGSGRCQQSR
jgi:glutathione S-transferase